MIGMCLGALLYFIVLLVSMIVTVVFTLFIKKNKKIFKYEFIIFTSLFILLIVYFGNYNTHIFIKSYLFPNKVHAVIYNNKEIDIKLPENSLLLYRTPDFQFYSKHKVNECKEHFKNQLQKMKSQHVILNYSYDENSGVYKVNIDSKYYFNIEFENDKDKLRYTIRDVESLGYNNSTIGNTII